MPYFLFFFGISDDSHSLSTEWMDEHVLGKVTIQDRIYHSCDEVLLGIMPTNGCICNSTDLRENGGDYSLLDAASLSRDGADESELQPDRHIPWRTISDIGPPDEIIWVESGRLPGEYPSGWSVSAVLYTWNDSWPDGYWFVNYRFDGKLRRTMARFRDVNGYNHRYYAVPWAAR